MEQTNRLMSRIQLANYFKQQCFDALGINPQRLGAPIEQETATGVSQAMQSIICSNRNIFYYSIQITYAKSSSNEN